MPGVTVSGIETSERAYRAFGLSIWADFALPGMPLHGPAAGPTVQVRLVTRDELEQVWSGPETPVWSAVFPDASRVQLELGKAADYLLTYGDRASFHVSPDGGQLLCAPAQREDPAWQRFLLDTALWTTSLVAGYEALHASAVEVEGKLIGFVGRTGGGKTTLAFECVRRGWPLFCDDVLAFKTTGGRVLGHPGPPVMNVPLSSADGGSEDGLGPPLATFEDELWVAVDHHSTQPLPIYALFLLERRPGSELRADRIDATALELLPAAVGHALTGHRRTCFEMFSDLAVQAGVYRLEADLETAPAVLLDTVLRTLD